MIMGESTASEPFLEHNGIEDAAKEPKDRKSEEG